MATVTEIRQRLIQGGMTVESAQQAAQLLADMTPLPSASGLLYDTLTAKGYKIVSRPTNTIFRLITNGLKNVIVMNKDGLNTLFVETTIDQL